MGLERAPFWFRSETLATRQTRANGPRQKSGRESSSPLALQNESTVAQYSDPYLSRPQTDYRLESLITMHIGGSNDLFEWYRPTFDRLWREH